MSSLGTLSCWCWNHWVAGKLLVDLLLELLVILRELMVRNPQENQLVEASRGSHHWMVPGISSSWMVVDGYGGWIRLSKSENHRFLLLHRAKKKPLTQPDRCWLPWFVLSIPSVKYSLLWLLFTIHDHRYFMVLHLPGDLCCWFAHPDMGCP